MEFNEQPRFYSDTMSFSVILPNRSAAANRQLGPALKKDPVPTEKTQSGGQKTQSAGQETQLEERKLNSLQEDREAEMLAFRASLTADHSGTLRTKTMEKICALFDKYRYDHSFNRKIISDLFGITENGASGFINKCIQHGIMRRIHVDAYRFVRRDK